MEYVDTSDAANETATGYFAKLEKSRSLRWEDPLP